MLILLLVVITLTLLLFLLSMVWPPDSPWSPWWRTTGRIARIQCELAKVTKHDIVYDLGCGDGEALLMAAKHYGSRGVGVEIDPLRYWVAKLRVHLAGFSDKIRLERSNFFDIDTSSATVVFMYLIPKTLNRLKPKLLKELKPGTRIVTFVYKIDSGSTGADLPMIAQDEDHEVYVYEIPKKAKKTA